MMLDFEKASRTAAISIWPDVKLQGCLFHFTQAIWRYASSIPALASKIRIRHSHHKNVLTMHMRLPFLRPKQIKRGLKAIDRYKFKYKLQNDFRLFTMYFEKTWLKRYKPKEWTIFKSWEARRTNNYLEAYNSSIKRKMIRRPNVFTFLCSLQDLSRQVVNNIELEMNTLTIRKDRSKLTALYKKAEPLLRAKKITIYKFLQFMTRLIKNLWFICYILTVWKKKVKSLCHIANKIFWRNWHIKSHSKHSVFYNFLLNSVEFCL